VRWFGDEWRVADDVVQGRVWEEYRKHLASLAPSLPETFRLLAEAGGFVPLHDGQILCAFYEHGTTDTLVLDMFVGEDHPPMPPLISSLHVRIIYSGAELVAPTLETLRQLIRRPKTAILYPEVDRAADGRFEHRTSLWTGRSHKTTTVAVRFKHAAVIPVRFQGSAVTVIEEPRKGADTE
jgi:hypothetical protein